MSGLAGAVHLLPAGGVFGQGYGSSTLGAARGEPALVSANITEASAHDR